MDFPIKERFEAFQDFCSLIQEWNKYAKLVSHNDAQEALPSHCADSISLAPTVHTLIQEKPMEYWDLGTGGGFPAIAICILNPELPTRLIERNTKKCTFLRKVCNRLGLKQVIIENQSFSTQTSHDTPRIFTSRAIEKPELVMPEILDSLSPEDVYLCQSESIHQLDPDQLKMFHVEPIQDEFSESGLRRNRLYQVTRIA
jgi:16S rRNA (guanine(527)-N(7))-methyltransferase RsmG